MTATVSIDRDSLVDRVVVDARKQIEALRLLTLRLTAEITTTDDEGEPSDHGR